MTDSSWSSFWESILKQRAQPVLYWYYGGTQEVVSAANLWTLALRRRHFFRKAGVCANDLVLGAAGGVDLIIDLVACAIGGYVFVPQSPPSTAALVQGRGQRAWLAAGSEVSKTEVGFSASTAAGDVLILFTSGTSGVPKPIRFTAASVMQQVQLHADYFNLQSEDTRLSVLPHWHAFGLILDLLLGMYAQQSVCIEPRAARAIKVLEQRLREDDIVHVALVPRLLELLIRRVSPRILERLRVHVGGAPLRAGLAQQAEQFCAQVVEGYGLTECGPGVLMAGRPLGCEVEIRPSAKGEVLHVKGPCISPSVECDDRGFFCTNDLALSENGKIKVYGRLGEVLKLGNGDWYPIARLESEIVDKTGALWAKVVVLHSGLKVQILSGYPLSAEFSEHLSSKIGTEVQFEYLAADAAAFERLEYSSKKGCEDGFC